MATIPKEYAMEYQEKIAESTKQLNVVRAQLQAKERDRKVFLKEDLGSLQKELDKRQTDAGREIEALQKAALKFDGELKEAEKNLDSLIKKVKEQQ
ncbi:hypothetical protein EDD86DRAFT_244253 [Gorgonomyces haynaldii]|nr:hypothetical protein EDD86DRAFT_244253 [Gorgonomyces haynaldii]